MKYLVLMYISVAIPGVVFADCKYGKRVYPEGTRIGSQICDESGDWVDKEKWLQKYGSEKKLQDT